MISAFGVEHEIISKDNSRKKRVAAGTAVGGATGAGTTAATLVGLGTYGKKIKKVKTARGFGRRAAIVTGVASAIGGTIGAVSGAAGSSVATHKSKPKELQK